MAFLYGDGEPSSLEIDYLGYLRRVIAVAVEVLLAEDGLVAAARRARAQEARHAHLVKRLEVLHQTVRSAVSGVAGSPEDDAVSRCANQIEGTVEAVVTRAVAGVRAQAEAAAADVAARRRTAHAACKRALEGFLRVHDLPDATRTIELVTGVHDGTILRLDAATPYGIGYELELVRSATPFAGEDVRAGAFHKGRVAAAKLERLLVTTARCEARTIEIELRSSRAAGADGFDIVHDRAAGRARLLRAGSGERVELTNDDASAVAALATAIGAALQETGTQPTGLRGVTIDDIPLEDHDQPSMLVDRVFAAMAPEVRRIVEHSKVPGELSLRRDVGDHRREEIFVTHAALAEMVAQVPSARRRHFAALRLPGMPDTGGPPSAEDVEINVDEDSSVSIQIEG